MVDIPKEDDQKNECEEEESKRVKKIEFTGARVGIFPDFTTSSLDEIEFLLKTYLLYVYIFVIFFFTSTLQNTRNIYQGKILIRKIFET